MAYADYLATRGYRRVLVERTVKQPGDRVLHAGGVEMVPGEPKVVALRGRGVRA